MRLYIGLALLFSAASAMAVAPSVVWSKKYNPADGIDIGYGITKDDNGNVYVVGQAALPSLRPVLLKYNNYGNLLWNKTLSNSEPTNTNQFPMRVTYDAATQCVYVGVTTKSDPTAPTTSNLEIFKINEAGAQVWAANWDNGSHSNEVLGDIDVSNIGEVAFTGGYFVSQYVTDFLVGKVSANGTVAWTHNYSGVFSSNHGRAVSFLLNDKIVAGGQISFQNTNLDGMFRMYENDGDPLISATFAGDGAGTDSVVDLEEGPAGSFFVGTDLVQDLNNGAGPNHNISIKKFNNNGTQAWTNGYDHAAHKDDIPTKVLAGPNGECYITGHSYNNPQSGVGSVTIKLDAVGDIAWVNRFDQNDSTANYPWDLELDSFGELLVAGDMYNFNQKFNYFTQRVGTDGLTKWSGEWDAGSSKDDRLLGIETGPAGNFYLIGSVTEANQNIGLVHYIYAPYSNPDTYSAFQDKALNVNAAQGLCANDTDTSGAIASLHTAAVNGSAEVHADGSFSYIPDPGFLGQDTFWYVMGEDGYSAAAVQVTIDVKAIAPSLLSITPNSVTGGDNAQGKVTMQTTAPNGGLTVNLTDNSTAITVPATANVPAGSADGTFTINTSPVSQISPRTVSATRGGVTKTATITLNPPKAKSLSLSPSTVQSGQSSTATVTLTGAAGSGGMVVTLADDSSAITTPGTVTVPSGAISTTFQVSTSFVAQDSTRKVLATANGVTVQAFIVLKATIGLQSLGLNPSTVKGGQNSTGTVTLNAPAGAGGVVVTLTDNSGSVSTPPSVTVLQGATTAAFTITTLAVAQTSPRVISATYNGVTKTATLTLTP